MCESERVREVEVVCGVTRRQKREEREMMMRVRTSTSRMRRTKRSRFVKTGREKAQIQRWKTRPSTAATTSSSSVGTSAAALSDVFAGLFGGEQARTEAKDNLLSTLRSVGSGASCSPDDETEVEKLTQKLERLNPTPGSVKSSLINGKWKLLYTTSVQVNGANKLPIFRPWANYQTIDTTTLTARNQESGPFFNAVDAELTPVSRSKVNVQFVQFEAFGGVLKFPAPESAKGSLDTTYLDDDLRVSRGDKVCRIVPAHAHVGVLGCPPWHADCISSLARLV